MTRARQTRRDSSTSLPPSSPFAFSDTEDSLDDRDNVPNVEDEDDDEGEDLFGEALEQCVSLAMMVKSFWLFCFHRDYAENVALDRYSDADIDDDDQRELTAAERRAVEVSMARRDRLERTGRRGARAARRSRAPDFLQSDDADGEDDLDELGVARMKRRTRRQYDERRDMDDLDGAEDVSTLYIDCIWLTRLL